MNNKNVSWTQVVVHIVGTGITVGVTMWFFVTDYVNHQIKEHANLPGHTYILQDLKEFKEDSAQDIKEIQDDLKDIKADISTVKADTKVNKAILLRIEDSLKPAVIGMK